MLSLLVIEILLTKFAINVLYLDTVGSTHKFLVERTKKLIIGLSTHTGVVLVAYNIFISIIWFVELSILIFHTKHLTSYGILLIISPIVILCCILEVKYHIKRTEYESDHSKFKDKFIKSFKLLLWFQLHHKLPDTLYKVVTLYHTKFIYHVGFASNESHALLFLCNRIASQIIATSDNKDMVQIMHLLFLTSSNMSVLTLIGELISNDDTMKFLESKSGAETKALYIKHLKGIEQDMIHAYNNYYKLKIVTKNSDLTVQLIKAVNNEV